MMAGQTLEDFFYSLNDEEIVARVKAGLTAEAHDAACRELHRRGIEAPALETPQESEALPDLGDMVILARDLKANEAHILTSCLNAAGIHASTGDINTIQTNDLWFIALGGAKVRVPVSQLADAQRILEAFHRGDFSLGDDFEEWDKTG